MIASIPSPASPTIDLGPLSVRVYGLLLAVGIVVAAKIAERRWERTGRDARALADLWIFVVVAGVVGARAYHVLTDYQRFEGDWLRAFAIWKGGLSIWGAVAFGALAVVFVSRRRGVPVGAVFDAVTPGLAVAQAIGRFGNWFNQELFGKPTTLPWALRIDVEHRPAGYARFSTFHPTFAYESLWCVLLAAAIVLVERQRRRRTGNPAWMPSGQVFAAYVAAYSFGRFFIEELRIDDAHHLAGLRVNAWVSIATFVVGGVAVVILGRKGSDSIDALPPVEIEDVTP